MAAEHAILIRSTDQLGNMLTLHGVPRRIVSLVPSQTELLFDLGLDAEVVGVTKFCTHPPEKVRDVVKVGGTKKFNFARIDALQPDLIIGNKEENYAEGIELLRGSYPVWMSDIADLDDALAMIAEVGRLVGRARAATAMVAGIRERFMRLKRAPGVRVAYFIWRKPLMVAGGENFINDLLVRAGLVNVFADKPRYPQVDPGELAAAAPEVVLLSSEPFPFTAEHEPEFVAILPGARVLRVDGTRFSWYGSRLLEIPDYLETVVREVTCKH